MLKLIKYELRATARPLLSLYAMLLLISLFNHFFWTREVGSANESIDFLISLFGVIGSVLFGFLISAVLALTVALMIQRFYRNLLGDEGYLMFTLPVPTWKLIASKAVVSAVWVVASFIAIAAAGTMATMSAGEFLQNFGSAIRELFAALLPGRLSAAETFFSFQLLMMFVLLLFDVILAVYAAIAIGHLWQRHRILGAFLAFNGIWILAVVILVNVLYRISGVMKPWIGDDVSGINGLLAVINVMGILSAAVCFFVTLRILSRKLNLE